MSLTSFYGAHGVPPPAPVPVIDARPGFRTHAPPPPAPDFGGKGLIFRVD